MTVLKPSTITDSISTLTATGALNFKNQSGTNRGSYTDAGIWSFPVSVDSPQLNTTTLQNKTSGGLVLKSSAGATIGSLTNTGTLNLNGNISAVPYVTAPKYLYFSSTKSIPSGSQILNHHVIAIDAYCGGRITLIWSAVTYNVGNSSGVSSYVYNAGATTTSITAIHTTSIAGSGGITFSNIYITAGSSNLYVQTTTNISTQPTTIDFTVIAEGIGIGVPSGI